MSQVQALGKNGTKIHYGLDHALGYFVTHFDKKDEIAFEADSYGMLGEKLNNSEIVEYLEQNLIDPFLHQKFLKFILLDLDICMNDKSFDSTGRAII